MPVREYAALVQEVSFGTPVASPTNGTSRHYMRLTQPFQGLMKPIIGFIPVGNGRVGPGCAFSDSYTLTPTIQGELYPSQTDFLMGWATKPINSGRSTPWTTTDASNVMPVDDLASISAYRGVLEASTMKRRRISGWKCASFSLSSSRNDPVWKFSASGPAIRDDTNAAGTVAAPLVAEIPDPVDTVYPCGPWLFSHLAGGLKIATLRTLFDGVTITFSNTISPQAFEGRYVQVANFSGREIKITVSLYRRPSPDDLATFRALTALDVQLTLANGTNTFLMDFGDKCVWTNLDEQLPMDSPYMWQGEITVVNDATAGTDFLYTYA